jgi:DNA replication protein DnaC
MRIIGLGGAAADGARERTAVCQRHGEYNSCNFLPSGPDAPGMWTGCPKCAEEVYAKEREARRAERLEAERAYFNRDGAAADGVKARTVVCPRHGEYRAYNFLSSIPDVWTGCPKCAEDAREKEREAERAERLEAERAYYSNDFEAMNIRKMYYEATFENFIAETEGLRRNRDAVKRFCDENGAGKLFLIGGCGAGKTHLACAAVRHFRGAIHTMFDILLSLKTAYDGGGGRTEREVLERLSSVKLLAIDEIGRTKGSEWEVNCLSHIVNARHESRLPTLFVSNRHFRSGCEKGGCEKCLDNYLGENILSRLAEDCEFLRFYEEDFRKKNRVAQRGEA